MRADLVITLPRHRVIVADRLHTVAIAGTNQGQQTIDKPTEAPTVIRLDGSHVVAMLLPKNGPLFATSMDLDGSAFKLFCHVHHWSDPPEQSANAGS
ncbi:MAG: hypothetical protein ABFC77_00075 [Thermoguttaceae bacterium]